MSWLAMSLAVACVEDVAKDKVAAKVTEPVVAPATQEAPTPAGKAWAIDGARSLVKAHGAKITKQHDILFPSFRGSATVAEGTLRGLEVEVDVASLQTDNDRLVNHLKSPDFFDVGTFAVATFKSSAVEALPKDGATHQVTGELTLRGVTKTVTFPATVQVSPTELQANAEFAINRQDWGVAYPGKPDDLIQDNVVLTIQLVAPAS